MVTFKDSVMTKFTRWLLRRIAKKLAKQGFSAQNNITEYYLIMHEAAANEYTENSLSSRTAFLQQQFNKATQLQYERETTNKGLDLL